MKVVFCWPEVSGYMSACWRKLAQMPGLDFMVLALPGGALDSNNAYRNDVGHAFKHRLLSPHDLKDEGKFFDRIVSFKPDIVYLPGWSTPAFVKLASHPGLARSRFIMGMDNPREDTFRQKLARFKIGRFLARMDRIVVAGERSWQFARKLLKIPEAKIRRGLYGVDVDAFFPCLERRLRRAGGWPRKFLFLGRYAPVKGVDRLLRAYQAYRNQITKPWSLTCCGKGAARCEIAQAEGVEDLGFVQPADLPEILERHGVFVLASRREPWGAVVAEAAAAGLPIVCTEACGAAVEIVRDHYNGRLVATNDTEALARAMLWMHTHYSELPQMGRQSQPLAQAYSARAWAIRWSEMFRELMDQPLLIPSPKRPKP